MFGIGETELFLIVLFGFLLFGPDKLPGMGRTIGKALRQFRQAQEGFTEVVQSEVMDPLSNAVSEGMGDDPKSKDAAAKRAAAMDEDDTGSPMRAFHLKAHENLPGRSSSKGRLTPLISW